jgi:16S rRNA (guanine527-N7)-methyltransferase
MTEEDARQWVRDHYGVPRETLLAQFGDVLREGSQQQNLISASSFDHLWARHLVDSAQLLALADGAGAGAWIDVGSGAGLPGLVIAILSARPVVLVEPRAKRAAFLRETAQMLSLADQVTVIPTRVEAYKSPTAAAVISARAVATLSQLLRSTIHCTDSSTVWLLPKGRNAHSEVEAARHAWQGVFHVEPSITQPESGIVVAREVRPR